MRQLTRWCGKHLGLFFLSLWRFVVLSVFFSSSSSSSSWSSSSSVLVFLLCVAAVAFCACFSFWRFRCVN
ncbi:hypothetical protein BDB00DRAFT_245664 [Zychaea mexicana]|uniref:uncharacterized protein n=1 Tax=Zychaea mexicana TaxID=64656 RepID=UPI0022FEBE10|nr:uncharacterized protein BDB00DRAFT_245664 [Zychaea mexicana]KAI9495378.1 hypothetical protein BDB00DRAFT_245664 [Zychaea mexicana]